MRAFFQARRRRERFLAGRAIGSDESVQLSGRDHGRGFHFRIGLDRSWLQNGQLDLVDAGEKFWQRMARPRAVKHQLAVDDIHGGIVISRASARTNTPLPNLKSIT